MTLKRITGDKLRERHEFIQQPTHFDRIAKLLQENGQATLQGIEPLYAIPSAILNELEKCRNRTGTPLNLISSEEYDIENKFSELCNSKHCLGYSMGVPITFPILQKAITPTPQVAIDKVFQLVKCLEQITKKSVNINIAKTVQASKNGQSVLRQFKNQQLGYLGWLHGNQTYLADLNQLKNAWLNGGGISTYLRGRNFLSQVAQMPAQLRGNHKIEPKLSNTFLAFYRRWDLDGFATWDLPIQSQPNLGGSGVLGEKMELHYTSALQLPATMKLPVRLPASKLLAPQDISHLQGWQVNLQKNRARGYATGFVINFFQDTILKSILGSRLDRRQTLLDELVLAAAQMDSLLIEMQFRNVDTIKKNRENYNRYRKNAGKLK